MSRGGGALLFLNPPDVSDPPPSVGELETSVLCGSFVCPYCTDEPTWPSTRLPRSEIMKAQRGASTPSFHLEAQPFRLMSMLLLMLLLLLWRQ